MAALPGYARWRLLRPFGPFQINICFSLWAHSLWVKFLRYCVNANDISNISYLILHAALSLLPGYCNSVSRNDRIKSLGPNFCYIMFISTGGLKDFQSSLNILSATPYCNIHRGLITLHFVITLQRIWLWNQLFFSSNMAEQEVLEQQEENKEERGNVCY